MSAVVSVLVEHDSAMSGLIKRMGCAEPCHSGPEDDDLFHLSIQRATDAWSSRRHASIVSSIPWFSVIRGCHCSSLLRRLTSATIIGASPGGAGLAAKLQKMVTAHTSGDGLRYFSQSDGLP